MWPFDILHRRRVRKLFGPMVPDDVLRQLETNPSAELPSPREGDYGFVVVQVAEAALGHTQELVGDVVDLAVSHKALVAHIISSIVICTYGSHEFSTLDHQKPFVGDLQEKFGNAIRTVHGTFHGLYGSIGGKQRFSFGPIFPETGIIFRELTSLDFGQTRELEPQKMHNKTLNDTSL